MKIIKKLSVLCVLLTQLFWSMFSHAEMPESYAMVFFFRSDCQYCHSFAPKLKYFSEMYRLPVYAFGLDSGTLKEFPAPIPSTPSIAAMFFDNPRSITVPATFLINVNSQKFVKVSVGDVSYDQLEDSINTILLDRKIMESMQ